MAKSTDHHVTKSTDHHVTKSTDHHVTKSTITCRFNGGVDHYRVKKDGRGMSVDDETFFSNLIELIDVSYLLNFRNVTRFSGLVILILTNVRF